MFWIDESLNGVEMVTLIPGSDRDSRTCRFNYMINVMFNVCSGTPNAKNYCEVVIKAK